MPKNQTSSADLTSGTPWKVMALFAVPLLIGNVVQQMYQVIDALVVGQHLGVNALAAVGSTSALIMLLVGFAWGMTSGFAIPTAQAFGAGDMRAVRRSVAAGTALTGVASATVSVVGVLFARQFLELMQTPPELVARATTFATVSFAGATATMFFNYLAAIIRAKGDSRTPLMFLVVSCAANVALVVLFVQVMDLGVGGAAGATFVAQTLSVALCFTYVRARIPEFALRREDWVESVKVYKQHLRIGLPMGFQMSIIAIGTLAVQVRLNSLGSEAVAAYTTAARVDGLAGAFLGSLGLAASTFVAQNFGADQVGRILTGVRQACIMAVASALVLAAILISFGERIILMFVGAGNEAVVYMAHQYLIYNGAFYVALGVLFITRGSLQGVSNAMAPTVSGVLELTMRVGTAVVLAASLGFMGIVWANPLAWVGAVLFLVPSWLRAKKNLTADAAKAGRERVFIDDSYPTLPEPEPLTIEGHAAADSLFRHCGQGACFDDRDAFEPQACASAVAR